MITVEPLLLLDPPYIGRHNRKNFHTLILALQLMPHNRFIIDKMICSKVSIIHSPTVLAKKKKNQSIHTTKYCDIVHVDC